MRLIGEFQSDKEAFSFQTFLKGEGISSLYDADAQKGVYRLWIVEEDDFEKARAFFLEWKQNPSDVRFHTPEKPVSPPPEPLPVRVRVEKKPSFSLTNLLIILCSLLFLMTALELPKQEGESAIPFEAMLPPIEQLLLFDYPQYYLNFEQFARDYSVHSVEELKNLPMEAQLCYKKLQAVPQWNGLESFKGYRDLPDGTLFHDIRQGEIWRLITPVFLHGNFLHILFNMAWLWMLGKQVEQRLGSWKYLALSLVIGVVSNVAQYLMSGPFFLGYSGIIVGLVGFIWMRQKKAPWEGYPLQRSVVVFIALFVVAMLLIELITMGLQFFSASQLYANVANTAHIVGGLCGIALARLPFFSRGSR